MPVHQTARFCNEPRLSHEQAINRIGKYLLGTRDKGIRYKIDTRKGLECYVDADFAGGWNQEDPHDAGNLMSRTGFVILTSSAIDSASSYWFPELAGIS